MSQKRLVTLILSIGIFLSLAATVFAAGQPRRYNENSTVKGTISQSFYQVNAKTDVAVKSIAVTGTLYEKGTFGTWQKVSSCSNTSTSSSCSASNNYNTKPGKSYRLDCSATFTYSNGQSETITSTTTHCNGVQREHNKKLNNGLPILHKVPPKRDYGRYFCIMAEKGGTSHGGLTEKLSPFFHAKKQEVNAYGR